MTLDKIESVLERLGYPVNLRGPNYIATVALFRDGDNSLGLLCYEDGPWDQIEQKKYDWPGFIRRVKGVSLKEAEEFLGGAEFEDGNQEEKEERIKLPTKLHEDDYFLIKSYDFFLKRGISKETLDTYGAGLSQFGAMYGRVCFPIREKGVLKGITGRDVLNRDLAAKWKIKGKKSEFVYPFFEPDIFPKTKQIILCESVGDSISLWNDGIKQNLVTFGTGISPKIISFILSQNPDKIFVSMNNDLDKPENRGQIGAAKIINKLSQFFSSDRLINAPPFNGDFGDQGQIAGENKRWAEHYGIKY